MLGRAFSAGPGRKIAIGELARTIAEVMGGEIEIEADDDRLRPAGCEVERLFADRRRLEAATGWGPTRTLWQGLAITVDWFTDPADLARYRTGSCAI